MSKKAFDKIMAGLTDALDIVEGRADPAASRVHIPAQIDTRAIRAKMRLSQVQFADRLGLSAAAVRDWEQGRRVSEAGSRAFLRVLSKDPEAVERAPARGARLRRPRLSRSDGASGSAPRRRIPPRRRQRLLPLGRSH